MIRLLKHFFLLWECKVINDPNNQDATVLRQNIVHLIYTSHSRQVYTESKRQEHNAEKSNAAIKIKKKMTWHNRFKITAANWGKAEMESLRYIIQAVSPSVKKNKQKILMNQWSENKGILSTFKAIELWYQEMEKQVLSPAGQ